MVDDNPQDVVHDLAAEAVFGSHPLGRPVIGRAEVIASISRRSLLALPPQRLHRPERRPRRGRQRRPQAHRGGARRSVATAAAARRSRACAKPAGRAPQPAIRFQRKSTEQYHVCLAGPGLSRDDPAALRVGAARRDPRRLGVVAALPGDPREARDGVLRLHLRVAVRRRRPDRDLRRHARGEPARVPRRDRRGAAGRRRRQHPRRRARAGEGEHEGPPAAVARVDLGADDAARQGDRDRHRDRPDRGDRAPDRGRHRRGGRRARARALRARSGSRRPGSARARSASAPPSSASTPAPSRGRHEGPPLRPRGQGRHRPDGGARRCRARGRRGRGRRAGRLERLRRGRRLHRARRPCAGTRSRRSRPACRA